MRGHLSTIGAFVRRQIRRPRVEDAPWALDVPDERWGTVRLSGAFGALDEADDAVVVLHGLAGCHDSPMVVAAAAAARRAGFAHLRLNMRGADRSGEDLFHAGLTRDVVAVFESPELSGFRRLHLLGFSLGGHVALATALESSDPRLSSVAAVSSPLDLAPAQRAFDGPSGWPYRRYMLARLQEIYAATHERRGGPIPIAEARRIRSIRDWDERIVAPWWDFDGADDYYACASVGPRIEELDLPVLLIAGARDPLVPSTSLRRSTERAPGCFELCLVDDAGHVGFSDALDLDLAARAGVMDQAIGWIGRHASG